MQNPAGASHLSRNWGLNFPLRLILAAAISITPDDIKPPPPPPHQTNISGFLSSELREKNQLFAGIQSNVSLRPRVETHSHIRHLTLRVSPPLSSSGGKCPLVQPELSRLRADINTVRKPLLHHNSNDFIFSNEKENASKGW